MGMSDPHTFLRSFPHGLRNRQFFRREDFNPRIVRSSYIEAMGGTLDIVASFPDGDVHISQFHEVGATP